MPQTPDTSVSHRSLLRRIGFTLAVLALYLVGGWIAIPGLDPGKIYHGLEPPSLLHTIFGLGLAPLLSAHALVETTKIVFPSLAHWEAAGAGNRAALSRAALTLALVLAAVLGLIQSITIAQSVDYPMTVDPGIAFHLGYVGTLVAATALLAWLADLITRFGIGSGFWVVLSVPAFLSVTDLFSLPTDRWLPEGNIDLVMTILVFTAGCTVLAAVEASEPSFLASGQLVWPPVLAYLALDWLYRLAVPWLSPEAAHVLFQHLAFGRPLRLAFLAFAIVVIFALRQQSLPARPGQRLVTGASLILVSIMGELLVSRSPYPINLDGRNIVIWLAIVIGLMASIRHGKLTSP